MLCNEWAVSCLEIFLHSFPATQATRATSVSSPVSVQYKGPFLNIVKTQRNSTQLNSTKATLKATSLG